MKQLLLLRHAVTEQTGTRLSGRTAGIHLSEEGRAQAKALAERLAPMGVQALYASPLERCQETAAAVAERCGLEVKTLDGVVEVAYGDWTGAELKELSKRELWGVVQGPHPSAARFPGGESLYEVQARAVAAVERLRGEHPGQVVAVASHADVIKAVATHYLGMHLDLFQRLVVSPASVTAFAFGAMPYLLCLNGMHDLGELRPEPAGEGGARDDAS